MNSRMNSNDGDTCFTYKEYNASDLLNILKGEK